MKKLTLALLALCMVASFALTSCKEKKKPAPTLKERIQGKTYVLGTVTKGGASVTSDFTGAKLIFDAVGAAGSITSGGTATQTVNVTYNVGESSITVGGTPPTGWAATLTAASAPEDGATFTFTVNINNPKTGAADHVFSLIKQ